MDKLEAFERTIKLANESLGSDVRQGLAIAIGGDDKKDIHAVWLMESLLRHLKETYDDIQF